MDLRELNSIDEVLDALGGLTAAGRLVNKTAQHVHNWRIAGQFPAKTYLVFSEELKARGKKAPLRLFGMIEPAESAA